MNSGAGTAKMSLLYARHGSSWPRYRDGVPRTTALGKCKLAMVCGGPATVDEVWKPTPEKSSKPFGAND